MSYEVSFKEVQGYSIGFDHGEDPTNFLCVVINGTDTSYVYKDDEAVSGEIDRFFKEIDRFFKEIERLTEDGSEIVLTQYGFDVVDREMGRLEDEDALGELMKYRGATLTVGDVLVTDDWVKFDAFYMMLDVLDIEYTLKEVTPGGEDVGI